MKNVIIIFFVMTVIAFPLQVFSQTERGNFLIGGSGGISYTYAQNSQNAGIGVAPAASYFFANRFAAGLLISYSFNKSTSSYQDLRITNFSIGPTMRYYFSIAPKWALFPQMEFTYGWQHLRTQFPTLLIETKNNSSTFKAGGGITYFITTSVGVEALLFYH